MPLHEPESGPSWSQRARLPGLAGVLDPADGRGTKNALIDRVQRLALERALGNLDGQVVLDFGCGAGRLSLWALERGATRVVGVDAEPAMVEAAAARVPAASFLSIDGRSLPFDDGAFDVVLCVGVLLYFAREPGGLRDILAELTRVLAAGGRLVAIEQVHEGTLGRGAPLEGYLDAACEASLDLAATRVVRRSTSLVFRSLVRLPPLARRSFAARLVLAESRLRGAGNITTAGYTDQLFVWRRGQR